MTKTNKKMNLYSFKNDYSEGTHPNILKAMVDLNLYQQNGYGEDEYTEKAISIMKEKMQNPDVDIHFVTGGTQANLIVISSILKPYESVICANSGHINVHETGAIEATGHKVNTIDTKDGKITKDGIKLVLEEHEDEHMVKPRLVYISNSTEVGTIYNKEELKLLYEFCHENNLLLYLDGARLGSALCSYENDLTLKDISRLVDVFYIGGTKNGALLGEAIVICNEETKKDFRFHLKQKGALLAKGRILGVTFYELFKNDLYFDLSKHTNKMAYKLNKGITDSGYKFLTSSSTNQIFPIFPNDLIEKLNKKYSFYLWCKIDQDNSAIRLVTSWATKEEIIDRLIEDIKSF
ncbi:MAG: low specificity L-threonine aldolase [Clostridiaceae bacterium]